MVVYGGAPLAGRLVEPMPTTWRHVLVWGGLRGSLSMVLILSLPQELPGRSLLVSMVFGVVAGSLFLQGLTIGPLLSRLGLRTGASRRRDYEVARLDAMAAHDAMRALDRLSHPLVGQVTSQLREVYRARLDAAEARSAEARHGADVVDEQLIEGLQELLRIERETSATPLRPGSSPPTWRGPQAELVARHGRSSRRSTAGPARRRRCSTGCAPPRGRARASPRGRAPPWPTARPRRACPRGTRHAVADDERGRERADAVLPGHVGLDVVEHGVG
ncbi:MAG: cation:proton antiporter [Myxococcota bacterium]